MTWYNADGDEFKNAKEIINKFYSQYYMTAESSDNATLSTKRFERKVNSSWQSPTWAEKN